MLLLQWRMSDRQSYFGDQLTYGMYVCGAAATIQISKSNYLYFFVKANPDTFLCRVSGIIHYCSEFVIYSSPNILSISLSYDF